MIELPPVLGISTPSDSTIFFDLLLRIRTDMLKSRYGRVVLDHSKCVEIAPEAALALLAEIQRCRSFCGRRSQLTGTYPASHEVSELLTEIGFFESLGIRPPKLPAAFTSRRYLKIERHNKTLAEVVDRLLERFSEDFSFHADDRKRLHIALVECMDNVFEHAYDRESTEAFLFREWWMLGYSDHSDGSISFTFYDQGEGIVSTIMQKRARRVLERLASWSEAKWLERAIRKPISRHASARRGHGLSKLKRFVDELGYDGRLRVLANRGDVEFAAGGGTYMHTHSSGLSGSLIVWTLRPASADHRSN